MWGTGGSRVRYLLGPKLGRVSGARRRERGRMDGNRSGVQATEFLN